MEQTREPIFTPNAGRLVGKAIELTHTALTSDTGKAVVKTVIKHGPENLLQNLSDEALRKIDPIVQAKVLLAEQSQNFEVMRGAIARIGESLAQMNAVAPGTPNPHTTDVLNAQAEAIQGLTLLVLKGQQVQKELIVVAEMRPVPVNQSKMHKWIYLMSAGVMTLSFLQMLF